METHVGAVVRVWCRMLVDCAWGGRVRAPREGKPRDTSEQTATDEATDEADKTEGGCRLASNTSFSKVLAKIRCAKAR